MWYMFQSSWNNPKIIFLQIFSNFICPLKSLMKKKKNQNYGKKLVKIFSPTRIQTPNHDTIGEKFYRTGGACLERIKIPPKTVIGCSTLSLTSMISRCIEFCAGMHFPNSFYNSDSKNEYHKKSNFSDFLVKKSF